MKIFISLIFVAIVQSKSNCCYAASIAEAKNFWSDEESNGGESDGYLESDTDGLDTIIPLNTPYVIDEMAASAAKDQISNDDTTTVPTDHSMDNIGINYKLVPKRFSNIRKNTANTNNPSEGNIFPPIKIVTTDGSVVYVAIVPLALLLFSVMFYLTVIGISCASNRDRLHQQQLAAERQRSQDADNNSAKGEVLSALYGEEWAEQIEMNKMHTDAN